MGCNAWNHSPSCNCGWGGVWYGSNNGSDSWLFNKTPKERTLGRQPGTSHTLAGGYTNPNALCPVCRAPVYFYESPYGGRVFFDELGPPWPQHPCTAHEKVPAGPHPRSWQQDDWKPLIAVHIEARPKPKGLYSITGQHNCLPIQLYFCSIHVVVADIVRYKKTAQLGAFLLSILYYDPKSLSWHVVDVTAYTNDQAALQEGPSTAFRQVARNANKKAQAKVSHENVKEQKDPAQTDKVNGFICPWCDHHQDGHLTTIPKHLLDTHGLIALGMGDKVTGFLRVQDMDPRQKARLEQIEHAAIELFDGDRIAATQWMHTPNKHISMYRPAMRTKNNRHFNSVLKLINKLQTGEVSLE